MLPEPYCDCRDWNEYFSVQGWKEPCKILCPTAATYASHRNPSLYYLATLISLTSVRINWSTRVLLILFCSQKHSRFNISCTIIQKNIYVHVPLCSFGFSMTKDCLGFKYLNMLLNILHTSFLCLQVELKSLKSDVSRKQSKIKIFCKIHSFQNEMKALKCSNEKRKEMNFSNQTLVGVSALPNFFLLSCQLLNCLCKLRALQPGKVRRAPFIAWRLRHSSELQVILFEVPAIRTSSLHSLLILTINFIFAWVFFPKGIFRGAVKKQLG